MYACPLSASRGPCATLRPLTALLFVTLGATLPAANYQDAVLRLSPTFYYQLNETTTDNGVVDSVGAGPTGSYTGTYGAGGPEAGGEGPLTVFNPADANGTPVPGVGGAENFAHYSNNAGHITLGNGSQFGASAMTVAMFFKAGPAEGGDRLFTNNQTGNATSFQIVVANDGLVLAVDPAATGVNAERTLFMEDNSGPDRRLISADSGWFHIIASTSGATGAERAANFKLWVNGVDRTMNLMISNVGWGTDTGLAKIGGRRADGADSTTHSGAQDEVAVWLDRVLTNAEAESLWEAAITEKFVPLVITDVNLTDSAASRAVTITWDSRPGKTYAVFASDDLTSGAWQELDDSVASEGDSTSFSEEGLSPSTARRWYRVVEGQL